MRSNTKFWTVFLASVCLGCGTSEGERLQFVGTWSFDVSDRFLPPAALSKSDEALTIVAKLMLSASTLELQNDGSAILTMGGALSGDKIPDWRILKGNWKVRGSGGSLSLQLNFEAASDLGEDKKPLAADREKDFIKQLVLSCVPAGEGSPVSVSFDEPNEFGVVNSFTRLLPSSTSRSSRIK